MNISTVEAMRRDGVAVMVVAGVRVLTVVGAMVMERSMTAAVAIAPAGVMALVMVGEGAMAVAAAMGAALETLIAHLIAQEKTRYVRFIED